MRYLLILILTLILTGEVMGGPKKKKKLEKKWTPVDMTEPVYTEPVNKNVQWKGIKIGGVYGKKPNFSALLRNFSKLKN
tara:strand:- start:124 stop:360 length:237 start_codon:yes stop_codon:yes gene_type:complete